MLVLSTDCRRPELPCRLTHGSLSPLVNVGHDLNLANLSDLIGAMPPIAEASIGHELMADALVMGFGPAVAAYKAALG